MKKYGYLLLLSITLLLVGACHSKYKNILSIQEMKPIVWDLMKADEWFLTSSLKDTSATKRKENIRLYEEVFAVHAITRDRFYNSYRYYEAHPPLMKILLDSVDQFSVRERNRLFENHGQATK